MIVANPDGYQYSFDTERLWRKNLRDNNGDGQITVGDGVDPNRNFAEHWGYDNEGSSPDPADETYRGPSAASEPETQAMQGLIDRIKPKFQSNLHSFGEWLLYPQGWQVGTLDADYPIYVGARRHSTPTRRSPGSTRGSRRTRSTSPTARRPTTPTPTAGTVAFTPELGEGAPGAGFVFPDDEELIQAEFEKTLDFHLGLARSAAHPATPVSPVGDRGRAVLPRRRRHRSAERADVAVRLQVRRSPTAIRRRCGCWRSAASATVTLRYRVNGGPVQSKRDERVGRAASATGPATATYYHVVGGEVTGTAARATA